MPIARPVHPGFLLYTLLILFSVLPLCAEELVLPDIILPGMTFEDILLPDRSVDIGTDWQTVTLTHRRVYPLEASAGKNISLQPPMPEKIPKDMFVDEVLPPSASVEVSQETKEFLSRRWEFLLISDIRYGSKFGIRVRPAKLGIFGAAVHLPYKADVMGKTNAQINWRSPRDGVVFTRLGLRDFNHPDLVAALDFNLLRSDAKTFSLRSDLLITVEESLRIAANAGGGMMQPLGRGRWFLSFDGDAGAFHSDVNPIYQFWGFFRLAGSIGRYFPQANLKISAGADVSYHVIPGLYATPSLNLKWNPVYGFSMYFMSGLLSRIENTLFNIVLENDISISSFVPLHAFYRLGAGFMGSGPLYGSLELFFRHGYFPFVFANLLGIENDYRTGMDFRLNLDVGSGQFVLKTDGYVSLFTYMTSWNAQLGYLFAQWYPYIMSAFGDIVHSYRLPVLAHERPIIGLGLEWKPFPTLRVNILGYAAIPLEAASLKIEGTWRL